MKLFVYRLRIVLLLCATIGWWGFFCPDLTVSSDTVRQISDDGTSHPVTADSKLYQKLLEAGGSRLRFRSRLLTEINAFFGG